MASRQAEAAASAAQPPREPRAKDPDVQALERNLQDRLGLAVSITARGRGGVLQLTYKSNEQLEGLIALLMPS
jgi:ParB family chromosome partitioning protein